MTKHHPDTSRGHDYLPAAGHDAFLPGYDLLTRVLGMPTNYDQLIGQAQLTNGHKVLEIGCGTGNLTIRASRHRLGMDVVGIDPDPRALVRAQRKAKGRNGIRFEQAYAQQLPFADQEFDRVLSSMMLHHLDAETKSATAAEVFRVLRPGGQLHVLDIGGHMSPDDGYVARRMMRGAHVAGNLGDALPRLLRAAGFECDEVASKRHRLVGRLTFYRAVRP